MNITYRNIDFGSAADCALLAKWANDPEIRHLATLYKDEASFATLASPDRFKERAKDPNKNRTDVMILLNDIPVGEMSFELYPESDSNPVLSVAWFSIVIGAAHARGKGLGGMAMTYLENLARATGATRAELGVFEFNERAQALYRRLGYREFKRIPNFTFWNGKMWTDIRMAKDL